MKKINEISDPKELIKESEILFEENRFEEALLGYQKVIQLEPDLFEAWHKQGEVYYYLAMDEKAIASFKKAIKLKEDKFVWFDMGMAYVELEEYGNAQECLKKSLAFDENYALAWNNLGFISSRLGDQQKALECFIRATELEHKDPYFWENLGTHFHQILKNFQEAAKCYEKVNQLEPYNSEIWQKLFFVYTELKKGKKVIQSIMNILQLRQEHDYLTIGTILYLLAGKDYELAREVFSNEKIQEEIAKFAEAFDNAHEFNSIAWSFYMVNLFEKGIDFSRQVVSKNPQFAVFQDTLACNLYGLGKEKNDKALLQEALKTFKEAIRYQINDWDISWKVVYALCKILGDEEELLQEASRYLKK